MNELVARWNALSRRERQAVAVAGLALAVLIVWLLLVQPALRTLRVVPAELDAADAQMQQLMRMAIEARELRETPPVPPAKAIEALRASLLLLGDTAKLTITGDRATVTLGTVDGQALADWLSDVRSAARARPIEAQLTRVPGGLRGSIVLQLGAAP